jgi:uncharacterized protein (TIGR00730 family)
MTDEFQRLLERLKALALQANDAGPLGEKIRLAETALSLATPRFRFAMMDRALRELHQVAETFAPHDHLRKVAIFGSARARPDDPEYAMAEEIAAHFVVKGWIVITGGGPGIMAAAQKGAGAADSFGLRILLPFENRVNETIQGDPKLLEFEYFFTRKLSFAWESNAFVLFPGGLGTLDESFEILTLMQTGKTPIVPVVMLERPGGRYWPSWHRFITEDLLRQGHVSAQDINLFYISRDLNDALEHILHFYSNFHSYRWCGQRLEILIRHRLSDEAMERLNHDFSSLLTNEIIAQAPYAGTEVTPPCSSLHGLSLSPHERRFGELRRLIDAINSANRAHPSA